MVRWAGSNATTGTCKGDDDGLRKLAARHDSLWPRGNVRRSTGGPSVLRLPCPVRALCLWWCAVGRRWAFFPLCNMNIGIEFNYIYERGHRGPVTLRGSCGEVLAARSGGSCWQPISRTSERGAVLRARLVEIVSETAWLALTNLGAGRIEDRFPLKGGVGQRERGLTIRNGRPLCGASA